MVKKKAAPKLNFSELIEELTPEQKSKLLEILQGMMDATPAILTGVAYRYQCPDYKKMTKPLAPCLEPIMEADEIDEELKSKLVRSCSSVPKEELEDALRNLILCIFAEFKETKEPVFMFLVVAVFWLMEHYELEACLDIILEILRQDLEFYDVFFSTKLESLLAIMLFQLGKNRLDELQEFMKETGLIVYGKCFVVEAVAHIAVETPERRQEVIDWFCKMLSYYRETMAKNDIGTPYIIKHIILRMQDIRGVETLPILKEINEKFKMTFDVSALEIPDGQMPEHKIKGLQFSSVDEYLAKNEVDYYVMDFDDDDYDPPFRS